MRVRFWGLLLAILGIFLVLVAVPRFTGLVVFEDSSLQNSFQVIGLILFIVGILLLTSGRTITIKHEPTSLELILDENKIKSRDTRPIIILDESGIIENRDSLPRLVRDGDFSHYGFRNIVIPQRIRRKIHNYQEPEIKKLADRTNNETNSPRLSEAYTSVAKYILDNSGKNRLRNALLPKIDDWIQRSRIRAIKQIRYLNSGEDIFEAFKRDYKDLSSGMPLSDFNRLVKMLDEKPAESERDLIIYKNIITTSREYRDIYGLVGGSSSRINNIFDMKDYLENRFKKDDLEDIELVGTALHTLRKLRGAPGKNILVYSKDVDIKEAIENIRKDIPYLEERIKDDAKRGIISERRADLLNRMVSQLKRIEYRAAG